MSDIYYDPVSGDIDITGNKVRLTTSNIEEVRQKVEIRLRTFKEEWFMNVEAGLPYFQIILQKGVSKNYIDAQVKSVTLKTNGVIGIESFNSEIDNRTRTYIANMRLTTSEGIVVINFVP
tara:strand:- start:317 stop:676 length:360 start_codon:yes stop_codon:yes gene_type:complete